MGIEESIIKKISADDINYLIDIVKANNLSQQQTNNLLTSWSTRKIIETNSYEILSKEEKKIADSQIEAIKNKLIKESSKLSNDSTDGVGICSASTYSDLIAPSDGTGVHWQVVSELGYNRASGNIDLPTVYINPNVFPAEVLYVH